ncbi:MAG: hypothetical protein KGO49_07715 [Gammaproteobacteria bacterium]|nr:hypothetical protein [Gammaproteobacteria bacterium]
MDKISQILRNSEAINLLQSRVHETYKERDKNQESFKQWQQACLDFHNYPDDYFFPNGEKQIQRVKKGHADAISDALFFLLADPVHFRSGYLKETLWRLVPHWSLSEQQKTMIENAALAYLHKKMRRDFWYMCRAMAVVGGQQFWMDVESRLTCGDLLIAKRASYLFAYRFGVNDGEMLHRKVSLETFMLKYQNRSK